MKQAKPIKRISATALKKRYRTDTAFRGYVSLCRGMTANVCYALFRAVVGILYRSVWFAAMAVYYFALGGLRIYLAYGYAHRGTRGLSYEYCCYRRTAWMLFLLNVPMGGMIALMVWTNSGFSYPGYVIYLSALFTFYTAILSVVNLVKYAKVGSPILSAAKVLNLVSGMMSVLGLQTAMITQFSDGDEAYRKLMNTLTGSFVYGGVAVLAVYMLVRDGIRRRRRGTGEQV